ncbi:hypothetical protein, partial [Streptomyces niveus]|uniref:hypothetical protein n=1 Tax=Streptomyces niveus TaxID=193462 RepID=UPI003449A3C2
PLEHHLLFELLLPAPAGDGPADISRVFTGDSETPGTAGASGAGFRAVRARADGQDPDAAYGAGAGRLVRRSDDPRGDKAQLGRRGVSRAQVQLAGLRVEGGGLDVVGQSGHDGGGDDGQWSSTVPPTVGRSQARSAPARPASLGSTPLSAPR